MTRDLYLRGDVRVEPLVCGWYAWPHLLAPMPLAFNIAFRYLPMLESFVANPRVHAAAAQNPELLCGPFLPFGPEQQGEVRALLARMQEECAHLIRLAGALRRLDQKLIDSARGDSLRSLSDEIDPLLSGLVELVYDLNAQPGIRLLEEMLAAADVGGPALEEICVARVADRHRGFYLNTPRWETPHQRLLRIPFADRRIDVLAQMRDSPCPEDKVVQDMQPARGSLELERWFTTQAPRNREQEYRGESVRVRYVGHACVLLQTRHVSIMVDPMIPYEDEVADGRFTFADLPHHIDYLVITHGHQDHCSPETLLQLRHRVGTVLVPSTGSGSLADPSLKLLFRRLGFRDVRDLDPLDACECAGGRIVSLPFFGEHADLDICAKQCVYVSVEGRSILFFADSNVPAGACMGRLREHVGKVDSLFIGMECHGAPLTWMYGPYLTRPVARRHDEARRLSGSNAAAAWRVIQGFDCSRAYVYAMGLEPWMRQLTGLSYTDASVQMTEARHFIERCHAAGVDAAVLQGSREWVL